MQDCSCEDIRRMIREEIANAMATVPKGARAKRAPSKYNLWIKECIPGKTGAIQDRFKACASEYKKRGA